MGLYLSQRKYAFETITETGLLGTKPVSTPLESNHQFAKSTAPLMDQLDRYNRLIRKLIYLTLTRLELSYVVHILSQFMHSPRKDPREVALRIVRYLKGWPGQGTLLSSASPLFLTIYCDSN